MSETLPIKLTSGQGNIYFGMEGTTLVIGKLDNTHEVGVTTTNNRETEVIRIAFQNKEGLAVLETVLRRIHTNLTRGELSLGA